MLDSQNYIGTGLTFICPCHFIVQLMFRDKKKEAPFFFFTFNMNEPSIPMNPVSSITLSPDTPVSFHHYNVQTLDIQGCKVITKKETCKLITSSFILVLLM